MNHTVTESREMCRTTVWKARLHIRARGIIELMSGEESAGDWQMRVSQQGMGRVDGNETRRHRSLQGLDSPWDGCMLIGRLKTCFG